MHKISDASRCDFYLNCCLCGLIAAVTLGENWVCVADFLLQILYNFSQSKSVLIFATYPQICFPYCFLLAHRPKKTGDARATTTIFSDEKRKGIKKKMINCFFFLAWLVASQMKTATIEFSFWCISWNLVGHPLQGKPEFRTSASFWDTRAHAIRSWAKQWKSLQMKNQRSHFWRL